VVLFTCCLARVLNVLSFKMTNGFSCLLSAEDKVALAGVGHSGEKSLAPQGSVGMRGARA